MSADIFAECRERVTAQEAAERYGLEVKKGWALCPFHNDKKPSLHFHCGGFKCFSCNASGSVIDFTAQYLGLSPLEAVKRLDADFSLGLDTDKPQDKSQLQRKHELANRHRIYEQWRRDTINSLNACIRLANKAEPPFSDGVILALKNRENLISWADALADGTPEQEIEIYRMREDVRVSISQILKNSPMK